MESAPLPPDGSFALHLLDVGQGEAILIDLPNRAFALIDAGPQNAAAQVLGLVDMRIQQGREFRFAALTHWDADHIGGLRAVLDEHSPLELIRPNIDFGLISEFCNGLNDSASSFAIRQIGELESLGRIQVRPLGAKDLLRDVGGAEFWSLAPGKSARVRMREALKNKTVPQTIEDLKRIRNAISLVLWIRVFGRTLFLPGEVDSDRAAELRSQFGKASGSIHQEDPRADWIKLSHHGSLTGTDGELIRIFGRTIFVASASHGAKYGHPHPIVLDVVKEAGGRAMCTRLGKGCSLIQQDPETYPSQNPLWANRVSLKRGPNHPQYCYGTVTVVVHPGGMCSVMGASSDRKDCPYGGPSDGVHIFPQFPEQTEANF